MARYIDADAFIGKLKTSKDFQEKYATFREVKMTTFFIKSVENEPTADVVEVVRCKDCDVPHNRWTGCPYMNGLVPPADHFCSYGKRKEREDG